jgi:hypothetical protein
VPSAPPENIFIALSETLNRGRIILPCVAHHVDFIRSAPGAVRCSKIAAAAKTVKANWYTFGVPSKITFIPGRSWNSQVSWAAGEQSLLFTKKYNFFLTNSYQDQ